MPHIEPESCSGCEQPLEGLLLEVQIQPATVDSDGFVVPLGPQLEGKVHNRSCEAIWVSKHLIMEQF